MTHYGKITHYNAIKGTGMISPEDGSDALAFDRTGLQQQAQEPRSDQLYTYGTQMGANGETLAVNLQMEQTRSADPQHSGQNGNDGGFDQTGQSQARAHQDAARRPGVDAQRPGVAMQHGESRSDLPNEGASEFQPLRADAGEMRQDDQQSQNQQGQTQQSQSQQGQSQQGQDDRDHNDSIQYDRDGDPVISQDPRGKAPNLGNRR